MPRKPPNPFDIVFERLLDEVLIPALDDKIRPVLDEVFAQMPKNGAHYKQARKRMRVNPRPTAPPYWEWPPPGWTAPPKAPPRRSLAPTHYDLLNVARHADQEIIRAAYLKLAQRHHPDKNPGDKQAEERMKLITAAYEVLSDPHKRTAYDRTL